MLSQISQSCDWRVLNVILLIDHSCWGNSQLRWSTHSLLVPGRCTTAMLTPCSFNHSKILHITLLRQAIQPPRHLRYNTMTTLSHLNSTNRPWRCRENTRHTFHTTLSSSSLMCHPIFSHQPAAVRLKQDNFAPQPERDTSVSITMSGGLAIVTRPFHLDRPLLHSHRSLSTTANSLTSNCHDNC